MNKNQYQNHASTFIENFEIFAGWLQPANFWSILTLKNIEVILQFRSFTFAESSQILC